LIRRRSRKGRGKTSEREEGERGEGGGGEDVIEVRDNLVGTRSSKQFTPFSSSFFSFSSFSFSLHLPLEGITKDIDH